MYKVVTADMTSLGLRKNPNIRHFFTNIWSIEPNPQEGKQDIGGIWCCEKLSAARALKKYYDRKHPNWEVGEARIFRCEIGNVLYQNSYRTKTDKIKLINEVG